MASYSVQYIYTLVDKYSNQVRKLAGASKQAQGAIRASGSAANAAASGYARMGQQAAIAERRVRGLASASRFSGRGGILGGLGGGIGAYGVAKLIQNYAEYEQRQLDIKKVYSGTQEQLEEIYAGLKKKNRQIPLPRGDIATILEEGIRAKVSKTNDPQELLDYTDAAAQFMVAFNLPVEEAAKKLAKLKSSLGMTVAEVTELGDTMNTVANSMATNEHEMLEFVSRVGGLAQSIGGEKGVNDVVAIGAAQMAAGTKREVAATGLRTLIARLGVQPKDTKTALKRLGLDPEKVRKALPKDIFGTIKEIMTRISKLKKEDQAAVLSQLAGMKAFDAFARLFGNIELLDQAQDVVTGKYRLKMVDEFKSRLTGLSSAIQIATNVLGDFGDSLVLYWRPEIAEFLAKIGDLTQNLDGNWMIAWGVAAYGLASALGLLLLPLAMLAFSFGALKPLVWALMLPLRLLGRAALGLGAGMFAGILAGSAGFARAVALAYRFAGALGVATVAFRVFRRLIGAALVFEGLMFLIGNLQTIKGLVTEIGAAFSNWWSGNNTTLSRETGSPLYNFNKAVEDTWLGRAAIGTGFFKPIDEINAQAKAIQLPEVSVDNSNLPMPSRAVLPLPNASAIPQAEGNRVRVESQIRGEIAPLTVTATPLTVTVKGTVNGQVTGSGTTSLTTNAPRGVSTQEAGQAAPGR
jgi:TP901 family phage tail tape measure protein